MLNRDHGKIDYDNIIIRGRPNFFFSCKNVFVLLILLGVISYIAPIVIGYISQIQVHLVRVINLPLTEVTAIIMLVSILAIIIWIIWILVSWTAKEYILFDHRITYKSGIILQKTIHMPYAKIQDVTLSQGILGKIVSVGTITAYSGYDESKLELNNINNPQKIEKTIFEEINRPHTNHLNQEVVPKEQGLVNNPNFNNIQNHYESQDSNLNNHNDQNRYNDQSTYDNRGIDNNIGDNKDKPRTILERHFKKFKK